jgi:site-specific recombinase XerD
MLDIDYVIKCGFYLSQERRLSGLAALSLKRAFKKYFSTYQSMNCFLHYFDSKDVSEEVINIIYTTDNCEQSSEVIIHFHHFFELVCKEIFRNENPLLAVHASKKHEIIDKLLKGEEVTEKDYEGLKSIEISLTIEWVCELIEK